jgi:hypothetical protein
MVQNINNRDKLKDILNKNIELLYVNSVSETENRRWFPSKLIKLNNNSLTEEQKDKLRKLIDKYWMCFSKDDEDIGQASENFGEHHIKLTDPKPIKQKPYSIPYAKEKVVNDCIDKMMKMGVIESSNSEWASPIVLVKKPDGSERFCVDYRKVNNVTIKDSFPMPNIESKLNKLYGSTLFTSLDCTSGYWQIRMSKDAKDITSFICSRGLFRFNVMPFGLSNAGATFQRVMEAVLNNLPNSSAYIDDVLTHSKNFEEHIKHLEKLFIQLKLSNIKVKTKKCRIACEETLFLGYKISKKGVSIDESRVKAIKDYPKPKNCTDVKKFLGLASYYRQFVRNFSDIVEPLNKLTRKKIRFKWDDFCEKAFNKLIELLTTTPVLAFPNFDKEFILQTDASNYGLGAVLSQKDDQDREHVIYYASRSLNKAERNYSTIERELLGIIYAVEKFRYYLYGKKFIIQTDHNPLTYLNNLTLSSSRLTRWRLKLAEYNFEIQYKKGKLNTNADELSRITRAENNESINKEDMMEYLLTISNIEIKDKLIYHEQNIMSETKRPIVMCISNKEKEKKNGLYKWISSNDSNKLNKQNLNFGRCMTINSDGHIFIYLVVRNSHEKLSYDNFENCIKKLADICLKRNIKELSFPKMMCSLGWDRIVSLLNENLIKQGIECHIYTNKQITENVNSITEESLCINNKIKRLQYKDKEIKELIDKVKSQKLNGYIFEDEVLLKYRKGRYGRRFKQLVVPLELRKDVLEMCHDNFTGAHLGEKKTWTKLNNRFYWPNSYKETMNYVNSCGICAKIKDPITTRAELKPITEFEKPFDMVAVDILELSRTSSGNKYVVVFTDYLTKWVEAFPIRDMKAETIAKIFINEIISRHSAPSKLLSDQGKSFLNRLVQSICDYYKINKIKTTPYHPQCDGLVERFNKTLCKMLSAYSNSNQTNWDLYLPLVLFAYRTAEQSSTQESPFNLLYGREPRLGEMDNFNSGYEPSEFIKNLHNNWLLAKSKIVKQAEANKKAYDSKYKHPPIKYKEGEEIRLKRPQTIVGLKKKLRNDLWSEPYKITKVISDQNVEIDLGNTKKVVNVNNIKKKEPERLTLENIRNTPTTTRSGRISKPRIQEY